MTNGWGSLEAAERRGEQANYDGELPISNPYPFNSAHGQAWSKGWQDGQQVRDAWADMCDEASK